MTAPELVTGETDGVVYVQGSLTVETVPALAADGLPARGDAAQVRLDLSGVRHADSAGLALLVDWLAFARETGCELVFERAPAQLVAIARVSGADGLLGLTDAEAAPAAATSTE